MGLKRKKRLGIAIWWGQWYGTYVLEGALERLTKMTLCDVEVINVAQLSPKTPEVTQGLDGLIAVIGQNEIWRLEGLNFPKVLVTQLSGPPVGIPTVSPDSELVGASAADHLVSRGLKHFVLFPPYDMLGGSDVLRGFEKVIQDNGLKLIIPPPLQFENDHQEAFVDWLRHLPRPCGMVFRTIPLNRNLVRACMRHGWQVPDDFATVRLLDERIASLQERPTLSSITLDAGLIGQRAAEMLEQLCDGHEVESVRIPPQDVTMRQSTAMLYPQNDLTTSALQYIRAHLSEPIDANAVCLHLNVSRVTLHRHFTERRRWSVHEEISRCRLDRAKQMLANTDATLKEVGYAVGIRIPTVFNRFFKARTGQTPTHYRRRHKKR